MVSPSFSVGSWEGKSVDAGLHKTALPTLMFYGGGESFYLLSPVQ